MLYVEILKQYMEETVQHFWWYLKWWLKSWKHDRRRIIVIHWSQRWGILLLGHRESQVHVWGCLLFTRAVAKKRTNLRLFPQCRTVGLKCSHSNTNMAALGVKNWAEIIILMQCMWFYGFFRDWKTIIWYLLFQLHFETL